MLPYRKEKRAALEGRGSQTDVKRKGKGARREREGRRREWGREKKRRREGAGCFKF